MKGSSDIILAVDIIATLLDMVFQYLSIVDLFMDVASRIGEILGLKE